MGQQRLSYKQHIKTNMCKPENNKENEKSVEEKLGLATRYMHQVKELGASTRKEDLRLVKRRVVQIIAEIQDMRDMLMESVKDRLSPRQVSVINTEEEEVETDPSFQFFGVEWDSVFAKCFSIGLNIRIFKQRLEGGMVDTIGLASILVEVRKVEWEMEQHSVAVLSGRLLTEQISQQLNQQLRVSQAGQVGRSISNLEGKGKGESRKVVKYKKNKTENLTTKLSSSRNVQRRKSTVADFTIKKKPSFLEKASSLLNY